jgi:hypothetical protein
LSTTRTSARSPVPSFPTETRRSATLLDGLLVDYDAQQGTNLLTSEATTWATCEYSYLELELDDPSDEIDDVLGYDWRSTTQQKIFESKPATETTDVP